MKNILWLSHILPYPLESGVILRSYNLIKELSKQHKVTVLAFNQKDNCPTAEHIDKAVKELSSFCTVAGVYPIASESSRLSKMTLLLKGLLPNNTYTTSWLISSDYRNALDELMKNNEFDIVHYDTISLAPYLSSSTGTLNVLNHHNIESSMMKRRIKSEKNLMKKAYIAQESRKLLEYEKKTVPLFDLNITCSELDADRLREEVFPAKNVEVIPNGVDTEYFYVSNSPEKPNSLVFAGSLSWYPNIEAMEFFFMNVWPLIVSQVPDTSISVIGKNPPDWLVEMGNQNPNVNILGYVEDVRPYIHEAAVYICPIKDGGGTKLKVLNALSMGKCIVADPIACEGIDCDDGEHLLKSSTAHEYVKSIIKAFNNKDLRNRLKSNSRHLAITKYDFERIGKRMSMIYDVN